MNTHLDLLQDVARSRLKFKGNVKIQALSKPEVVSPEFGPQLALTISNDDASEHLIKYVIGSQLADADFFHEFCHVKLNEIGFKKVEIILEQKIGLCCKSKLEQEQLNKAVIFIAETYAESLQFRYFKEESELVREQLDCSYLFTLPLRRIVRELGYSAIAQAVGYRLAKKWCGYTDDAALQAAFGEAFRGNIALRIYTQLYLIMSELPPIRECNEIQNMTSGDIDSIVECVLNMFENEKLTEQDLKSAQLGNIQRIEEY